MLQICNLLKKIPFKYRKGQKNQKTKKIPTCIGETKERVLMFQNK